MANHEVVITLTRTTRTMAKDAARTLSSATLRAVGVDVTNDVAARPCLVIAAHPDDETLGCGAAIARMRSRGTDVHVVFVSGGGQSPRPAGVSMTEMIKFRREEAANALEQLGVAATAVVYLDFEDGQLTHSSAALTPVLADLIRTTAPAQVFVTSSSDRHPDHVAVGQVTRDVVSRSASPPDLYEYPIWQRVPALTFAAESIRGRWAHRRDGCARSSGRPRLVRADGFLAAKRQAIDEYQSQLPHFPPGFIEDFLLPHESFRKVSARLPSP